MPVLRLYVPTRERRRRTGGQERICELTRAPPLIPPHTRLTPSPPRTPLAEDSHTPLLIPYSVSPLGVRAPRWVPQLCARCPSRVRVRLIRRTENVSPPNFAHILFPPQRTTSAVRICEYICARSCRCELRAHCSFGDLRKDSLCRCRRRNAATFRFTPRFAHHNSSPSRLFTPQAIRNGGHVRCACGCELVAVL